MFCGLWSDPIDGLHVCLIPFILIRKDERASRFGILERMARCSDRVRSCVLNLFSPPVVESFPVTSVVDIVASFLTGGLTRLLTGWLESV